MPFPRTSGILLHPTSLPGRFGIGDLGAAAYQFVDFLAVGGQQIWQILPLGPTGHGNSPYMSYSSMAGNPLLISPEALQADGFLSEEDFANLPDFAIDFVDYDAVAPVKMHLLAKAVENFRDRASAEQRKAFEEFCSRRYFWLDDYAFFMALKEAHNGQSWHEWDRLEPIAADPDDLEEPEAPEKSQELEKEDVTPPQSLLSDIAMRQPAAMMEWRSRLQESIDHHKYLQFLFFQQWSQLKQYANRKGIQIFGDMPIYVAHDSADVWAQPHIFHLDPVTGEPAQMAGVPPDYFSETGQLWGNPIYNWEVLKEWNFQWWIHRLQALLEFVDLIRIDHFRGFQAYWQVPQGETTAINGEWIEAPGTELFDTIKQELGSLPIVAEDLGVITPDVEALRDRFDFPGMKILQFAFGSDAENPYLPFCYPRNSVVYTGTHDNNTTMGWFHQLSDWERDRFMRYLGHDSTQGIHWDLIRMALSSVSNQAIFPLQDILGLGADARMNTPGQAEGNWAWRYRSEALNSGLSDWLRSLTQLYGRSPA